MESISGDKLRGHLQTMVLSSLEDTAAHGFEILKRIEAAGSGALKMKEGSLYPALYRMESAGLIKAEWEDGSSERRGPRRRIYSITRKGRRKLDSGRNEWNEFVRVIGTIIGATA